MLRTYRFLLALSTLGLGCSGSSGPGNDEGGGANSGGTAGLGGGVGGSGLTAGSSGGSTAMAGAGGSHAGSAGSSAGTGGASAGTGGGASLSGAGGTSGGASGGGAGTETGEGGEGATGTVEPKVTVSDPDATGAGSCESTTLKDVIDAIHEQWPELADISALYDPNLIGGGSFIHAFRTDGGFSLAFDRGSGDCPAGCISHEYWYFETDQDCAPVQVGHYGKNYESSGNCYRVEGEPLWGVPPESQTSSVCPAVDLSTLNSSCEDDMCPAGLEPLHFYGVAGMNGPEFCWCSIVCEGDPSVCPDGTACISIGDGPYQPVCYEQ